MSKSLLPIFYTVAGVVVAGLAGYAVVLPQFDEPQKQAEITQPAAEEEQEEVASISTSEEETGLQPKEPEGIAPVPPAFTLLRVEKDGSTVVAGTGPADSEVTLFNGREEIATAKSGPTGDFAFVLDTPLAPGPHELHLSAKPSQGEPIASLESGLINVPEPASAEEPTVLVSAEGTATKVLQKPEEQEPKSETVVATASESVEIKEEEPVETTEAPQVVEEPEVAEEAEVATLTDQGSQEQPVQEQPTSAKPVLIEAADIENGKIFIAGTGEPGTSVSIYLENELLGTALVEEKGAFLFEGAKEIAPGNHSVRADMTDRKNGKVVARAEVRLIHEPKVVAQEPKPEPEIQTAVVEESEPEPEVLSEETEPTVEVTEEEAAVNQEEVAVLVEPEEDAVPEIRTGSAVIIRRGDNLWQVARRNYGSGIRYTTIFDANRDQIRDPDLIYPGQVFKVPENEAAETESSRG